MTLDEALKHPRVNIFIVYKSGNVFTYKKPNERIYAYNERHRKNKLFAQRLRNKKPA